MIWSSKGTIDAEAMNDVVVFRKRRWLIRRQGAESAMQRNHMTGVRIPIRFLFYFQTCPELIRFDPVLIFSRNRLEIPMRFG